MTNVPATRMIVAAWCGAALAAACVFALPLPANADGETPVVVVFFSGLCNSPDACRAAAQAQAAIRPRLPQGTRLLTPDLVAGAFRSQAEVEALVKSLGGENIVFIAYSAGYKAFAQTVDAMDSNGLKRIKTIVSLEAEYNGFENALKKVRSANPSVKVERFTSAQFGTNHGSLPSAVGDAISRISAAAQSSVASLSTNQRTDPVELARNLADLSAPPPPTIQPHPRSNVPNLPQLFPSQASQPRPQASSPRPPAPLVYTPPQAQPASSPPFQQIAPFSPVNLAELSEAIRLTIDASALRESKPTSSASRIGAQETFNPANPTASIGFGDSTSVTINARSFLERMQNIIRRLFGIY